MKILGLKQTSDACPSQWEFRTDEDRPSYVRYRWGWLSVCCGPPGGTMREAARGTQVVGVRLGNGLDGVIAWEVVVRHIQDLDVGAAMAGSKEKEF